MKRRAQRVIRADKDVLTEGSEPTHAAAAAALPISVSLQPDMHGELPIDAPAPAATVDIFGKFQTHRDDFDPHWLMLEDDTADARSSPITPALAAKLERHRGQLSTVRQTRQQQQMQQQHIMQQQNHHQSQSMAMMQRGGKETGPVTVRAALQEGSRAMGMTQEGTSLLSSNAAASGGASVGGGKGAGVGGGLGASHGTGRKRPRTMPLDETQSSDTGSTSGQESEGEQEEAVEKDKAHASNEKVAGSDDEEEYVPESEGARQYNQHTPSSPLPASSPVKPRVEKFAMDENDESTKTAQQEQQEQEQAAGATAAGEHTNTESVVEEGLSGDFLTFLPKPAVTVGLGGQQYHTVQADELQATITLPNPSSMQASLGEQTSAGGEETKGRGGSGRPASRKSSTPASPTTAAPSATTTSATGEATRLVVPLWSVRRMQIYGGYCHDSPLVALHQEITDLCDYLAPTQAEVSVRRYIELEVSRLATRLWPQCEVLVYGSLSTHLLLPLSDIDITILHVPTTTTQDEALTTLAREINAADLCHGLYPQLILKTKVPLVKFQHKGSRVDVDISVDASDGKDNSQEVVRLLRRYPEARALILVIKYFLQQRDMHEPYRGGLGSYATTLLVISFLQHHPIYTTHPEQRPHTGLGKLLVDFFRYYGQFWSYGRLGVSVEQGGYYFQRQDANLSGFNNNNNINSNTGSNNNNNRIGSPRTPLGPPQAIIEDPGKPSNNAASSLRNFHAIASAFTHAYMALTANFDHERIDRRKVSPDASDIALRPTLLSRILHVDAEMVSRRQNIAATYATLCTNEPIRMEEVRQYRSAEDNAMLQGGRCRAGASEPGQSATGAERRSLATLAAAALARSLAEEDTTRKDTRSTPTPRALGIATSSSSSSASSASSSSSSSVSEASDSSASNASSVRVQAMRAHKRRRHASFQP